MINIEKKYKVLSGEAPFTYYVQGVHTLEETSDGEICVNFTFFSQDVIEERTISVVDSRGCTTTITIPATDLDPCTQFVSEIIINENTYSIESPENIDVTWSIDDEDYYDLEVIDSSNSVILTQTNSGIQQTNLRATITNDNGCEWTRRLSIFPCRVFARNSTVIFRLNDDRIYEAIRVPLYANSSCTDDSSVDWSTATIINNTGLTITQRQGQPYIDITTPTFDEDVVFSFTVSDSTGRTSNRGNVTVTVDDSFNGFTVAPLVSNTQTVEFDTTTFTEDINGLGLVGDITVNSALTTANSATISDTLLTVDMVGQANATVGLNSDEGQNTITFVRELEEYAPAGLQVNMECTEVIVDPSDFADVFQINSVVSGDATYSAISKNVTVHSTDQLVILNVSNTSGQSSNVNVYVCGQCIDASVTHSTCESVLTPYDLLSNVGTEGTWFQVSGPTLAITTYNEEVTLPFDGTYVYEYTFSNTVEGYSCTALGDTTQTLTLTKTAAIPVSNDVCATPQTINDVTTGGTISYIGSISSDCTAATTWSGQLGALSAHTYDQWLTTNISSGANNVDVTITLTGVGNNPISDFEVQAWSSCAAVIAVTRTSNLSSTSITYTVTAGTSNAPLLLQVLSNSTGNYVLSVNQEIA